MAIKNSNDTIGNRTRDLLACSAVPQPSVPPRAPNEFILYLSNPTVITMTHNTPLKYLFLNQKAKWRRQSVCDFYHHHPLLLVAIMQEHNCILYFYITGLKMTTLSRNMLPNKVHSFAVASAVSRGFPQPNFDPRAGHGNRPGLLISTCTF